MKKDRPTKTWNAEGTSIMLGPARRKKFLAPKLVEHTGKRLAEQIGSLPVGINVTHSNIDLIVRMEDNFAGPLH